MAIGYQCTKTLFDIMSIVINKKKYSGVINLLSDISSHHSFLRMGFLKNIQSPLLK